MTIPRGNGRAAKAAIGAFAAAIAGELQNAPLDGGVTRDRSPQVLPISEPAAMLTVVAAVLLMAGTLVLYYLFPTGASPHG